MRRLPELIPITDFRQGAASVLETVRSTNGPVVVTQRGRAAAVMLSVEAYEQAEEERRLLRALARGEKEIAAGLGHDLDEVLAEADVVLAERAG